jgi:hypothetical protein
MSQSAQLYGILRHSMRYKASRSNFVPPRRNNLVMTSRLMSESAQLYLASFDEIQPYKYVCCILYLAFIRVLHLYLASVDENQDQEYQLRIGTMSSQSCIYAVFGYRYR